MNEQVFSILEQIYVELYEMFQFDDFHFGGTDMSFKCWNSSSAVTDYMLQRDHLANLDDQGVVPACHCQVTKCHKHTTANDFEPYPIHTSNFQPS